jgi:hypothetical protein
MAANSEKAQQDFCKGALDSIQNLLGRMDLKAGIVLTVVGLLSAAVYALAASILNQAALSSGFRWLLVSVLVLYFISVVHIFWQTTRVFLARPPSVGNYSQAPLMLYPLLISQTFKSDKEYAEKAMQLTHANIIADYSNQIMECSNIYRLKHTHVNRSIGGLRLLFLLWFIFVVAATVNLFVQCGNRKDLPLATPKVEMKR